MGTGTEVVYFSYYFMGVVLIYTNIMCLILTYNGFYIDIMGVYNGYVIWYDEYITIIYHL